MRTSKATAVDTSDKVIRVDKSQKSLPSTSAQENMQPQGSAEQRQHVVVYSNGAVREDLPSGVSITRFNNADVKRQLSDGTALDHQLHLTAYETCQRHCMPVAAEQYVILVTDNQSAMPVT